jgi:hypothetical protein
VSESLQTTPNDKPWRFQRGNKAAVGHQVPGFKLREAVRKATKASDVKAVFEQLAVKARNGDMAAVKLFLAYAVGEPSQMVDVIHHGGDVDIPAQLQEMLKSADIEMMLAVNAKYLAPPHDS